MPYRTEWVEPEIFLTHKGVTVWHCYKDDEYDRRLWFWFTVTKDGREFDVRELKAYKRERWEADYADSTMEEHASVIKAAIESGELKQEDEATNITRIQ